MSNRLSVIVVRADGRILPRGPMYENFDEAGCEALRIAERLSLYGCPLGDPRPPRSVDVLDEDGALMFSVVVDHASSQQH